jgi:hypothetical protein
MSVYHQKFGTGTVVERWGSLVIKPEGKGKAVFAPCNDVFDVIFGNVIHCCRREFLRPTEPQNIMMADSGGWLTCQSLTAFRGYRHEGRNLQSRFRVRSARG